MPGHAESARDEIVRDPRAMAMRRIALVAHQADRALARDLSGLDEPGLSVGRGEAIVHVPPVGLDVAGFRRVPAFLRIAQSADVDIADSRFQ